MKRERAVGGLNMGRPEGRGGSSVTEGSAVTGPSVTLGGIHR